MAEPTEPVASIRKGTGYVDTANDLLSLARLFRGRWPELEGKVPVTIDEVAHADGVLPKRRPNRRRRPRPPRKGRAALPRRERPTARSATAKASSAGA